MYRNHKGGFTTHIISRPSYEEEDASIDSLNIELVSGHTGLTRYFNGDITSVFIQLTRYFCLLCVDSKFAGNIHLCFRLFYVILIFRPLRQLASLTRFTNYWSFSRLSARMTVSSAHLILAILQRRQISRRKFEWPLGYVSCLSPIGYIGQKNQVKQ